ncbi:hypothetical protein LMG7974_00286 [Campylobacter majalis]|uniref:Uncharacterized protein n=1 Tax=Campylobacter majalis TaxID=2790656 RepID=A0ABM8Q3K1_9BACT|nr:hypothetical protein [Campylobacter majalis]CAD7287408.1 hypothetical protein LMG7974_00286 [Campylobacter majalis]
MNDFFDSLKQIKKEMTSNTKETKQNTAKTFSKDEAIAHKEQKLRDEFLSYIKDNDIIKK